MINNTSLIVYDRDKIELIKKTICKGATDDELNLFIAECQRTGLDPFLKQIYSIQRRSWNAETKQWEAKRETQTAIDGFRAIAERTGKYIGELGPYWCGKDGQWIDIWLHEEHPEAAKVGVLREGFKEPTWAVAVYAEYVQVNSDGKPNRMWAKMPANQLAICAERQALRKAFPRDMAGLVPTDDLLGSSERETVIEGQATVVSAPAAESTAAPAAPGGIPATTVPPDQVPPTPPPEKQPVAAKTGADASEIQQQLFGKPLPGKTAGSTNGKGKLAADDSTAFWAWASEHQISRDAALRALNDTGANYAEARRILEESDFVP